jgi:AraC-like DNA-binding protein
VQADLGGLNLFAERANRQVVECGHVLPSSIVLAWVAPASAAPTSGRGDTSASLAGFSRAGGDWVMQMPGDTELLGVTMPAAEFDRLAEPLRLANTRSRQVMFKPRSRSLSQLHSGILDLDGHAPRLSCADVRAALRNQLVDAMFGALSEMGPSCRPKLTRLTYSDLVKRSQTMVLGDPERPHTVLDLCTKLRVCRRTLQKSFLEVTGQAPSSYLRCVRLAGVRRLLRSTPASQMMVGDAAARWGFFHLGSFAGDYRRLFGELPSRTQRACVGH